MYVTNPSGSASFIGKNRNPFAVWFFSVITLGIYFWYWYYMVNAEIGRHEPTVKTSPAVSLLAVGSWRPISALTM